MPLILPRIIYGAKKKEAKTNTQTDANRWKRNDKIVQCTQVHFVYYYHDYSMQLLMKIIPELDLYHSNNEEALDG